MEHNTPQQLDESHIVADRRGGYKIDHLIKGDSVSEVLGYLEYNPAELLEKMRVIVEHAVTKGSISVEDSADFLRLYEEGLLGYTYLED